MVNRCCHYKDHYKIIAIAWHNIGALDDNGCIRLK